MEENLKQPGDQCPVTYCLKMIGGKWKPIILFLINNDVRRFGTIRRHVDGISKQMLTKQLRELETDAIVDRTIYDQVPPRVDYTLTARGKSLLPVIEAMKVWGEKELDES